LVFDIIKNKDVYEGRSLLLLNAISVTCDKWYRSRTYFFSGIKSYVTCPKDQKEEKAASSRGVYKLFVHFQVIKDKISKKDMEAIANLIPNPTWLAAQVPLEVASVSSLVTS